MSKDERPLPEPDYEGQAWRWLTSMPRLPGELPTNQVVISVTPGDVDESGSGPQAFVVVTLRHPGLKEQIGATGGSLVDCVESLYAEMERQGLNVTYPLTRGPEV